MGRQINQERIFGAGAPSRESQFFAPPGADPRLPMPDDPMIKTRYMEALLAQGPTVRKPNIATDASPRATTSVFGKKPLVSDQKNAASVVASWISQAQDAQPNNPAEDARPGETPETTAPAKDVAPAQGNEPPHPNRGIHNFEEYRRVIELRDAAKKRAAAAAQNSGSILSSLFNPIRAKHLAEYNKEMDEATLYENQATGLAQAYAADVQAEMKQREAEAASEMRKREALAGIAARTMAEGPKAGPGGKVIQPRVDPKTLETTWIETSTANQDKSFGPHTLGTAQGLGPDGKPVVRVSYLDHNGNKRIAEIPGTLGTVAAAETRGGAAGAGKKTFLKPSEVINAMTKIRNGLHTKEQLEEFDRDPSNMHREMRKLGLDWDPDAQRYFQVTPDDARKPEKSPEQLAQAQKGVNWVFKKDTVINGRTYKAGEKATIWLIGKNYNDPSNWTDVKPGTQQQEIAP